MSRSPAEPVEGYPFGAMVTADLVRSFKGRPAKLKLTDAAGGGSMQGTIVSCLESADGLVAYLVDPDGQRHTIHYQHIAALEPLEFRPEA
jgi:hypothetical protein